MARNFIVIICLTFLAYASKAQDINFIKYNKLQERAEKGSKDTLYIINFWATWCGPCVKELPYFEEIQNTYQAVPIKVILLSLDFKSKKNSQVLPFVKSNIKYSEVLMLDEANMDEFINAVNEKWSGAIPATIIFHKNAEEFYEKSFEKQELKNIVEPLIKSYEKH